MLSIRRLDVSDALEMRRLRLQALQTDAQAFSARHENESQLPIGAFEDKLRNNFIIGAIADGLVGMVGVCLADTPAVRRGMIWGMYVDLEFRGRGIATRMMEEIIRFAVEQQWESLHLSVAAANTAARTCYESLGFAVVESASHAGSAHGGDSDYCMVKKLEG